MTKRTYKQTFEARFKNLIAPTKSDWETLYIQSQEINAELTKDLNVVYEKLLSIRQILDQSTEDKS